MSGRSSTGIARALEVAGGDEGDEQWDGADEQEKEDNGGMELNSCILIELKPALTIELLARVGQRGGAQD